MRLLVYVGLLYQDLIRREEVKPGRPLPPVLPIVLYNGDQTWTPPVDLATLLPQVPGLVADDLPRLKYLLIDENRYTEAELAAMRNLVAAVIRFEHPAHDRDLLRLIDLLNDWLAGQPELKRIFALWIRALLRRRSKNTLIIPEIRGLEELKMTLAEKFDQWAEEYKRQGMQKGIQEGEQKGRLEGETLILQRLLTRRFGPLPPEALARIASAAEADITRWADQVLDAGCFEEVFRV
ncbi:MAG: Rpn family recombination-promoting nuclease/putative transposase [Chromatiaceae bacterium]|nr:Rpn family recombination-promoting nuclease/putative transposase [Candidatus Thioaporhodococcus sediminis]